MSFSANSTISSWRIVMSTSPEIFLSKSFSPPETCQLAQFARGQPSLKFPGAMSKCMSNEHEQANLYSIFFTCISPPRMSSSRMKYAFSKLKIMSSSHTDPKYLSSTSTYLKTVLEVLERTILHWAALMVLATKEAQSVEREPVNNLQHVELVISAIHSKAEEKACVALVNNLK